ncbi:MAG: hypothetical protein GY811_06440 [Myxococcales bacterium]|nr:hypothetical protein [Myxococcales bacterium]
MAFALAMTVPELISLSPALADDRPLIDDNGELVRAPPRPEFEIQSEHVSKILFLNRCAGGCPSLPVATIHATTYPPDSAHLAPVSKTVASLHA